MARTNGMTSDERFFRQWFAVKQGGFKFNNHESYTCKQGISDIVRNFNNDNKGSRKITYPTTKKYITAITNEIRENGLFQTYTDQEVFGFEISEELVDVAVSVSNEFKVGSATNKQNIDDIREYTMGIMSDMSNVSESEVDDIDTIDLGDMDFDKYDFYQSGTVIDRIMSDTQMGVGLTNKSVTFAIGESGVGKSTQLMDLIALYRDNLDNQCKDKKFAFVSVEMMKSDLAFYIEKNPIAKRVPTITLMDYIIGGNGIKAISQIFLSDKFDFIVLDSFQDLLIKLVQYCGLRPSEAQQLLLNLLIASAERFNKTIIAIQHMTKSGEYVGSTFLKHSVTAMLEYRFDNNERYMTFSKNRRCGSMERMKIYFSYNKETKRLEYDESRFNDQIESISLSKEEMQRNNLSNLQSLLDDVGVDQEDEFDSESFDVEVLNDMQENGIEIINNTNAEQIIQLTEQINH